MKSKARNHNITFADKLLILLLSFLSLFSFFFIKEVMPQGSYVNIEVDGKLTYTLPLYVDKTVDVGGPLGKTIVEINGNRVRIKESPCYNRFCIHQGWISSGALICLPNKVIVNITGTSNGKDKGIDGITG